jgi:hypothetical protein
MINMNGFLRVNTFLRDVAFINGQNIKTVYFHTTYYDYHKGKKRINAWLFSASLPLLRDRAICANKKLLGNNWTDFRYGVIMNSYVTTWLLYNLPHGTVLHIYSTNMPKGGVNNL